MADHPETPGTVPVTDRRPVPRGVLPRRLQTWAMVALAAGMLLIIVLTGQPEAPSDRRASTAVAPAPDPDRVRDYQDRLRALDAQAAQDARAAALEEPSVPPAFNDDPGPPAIDPIAVERQRRAYESLFASNVVLSRRPDAQRPDADSGRAPSSAEAMPLGMDIPSIDDIAAAVVRATTRNGHALLGNVSPLAPPGATPPVGASDAPAHTGPISARGPLHRLLEGTIIDTVLTHRLDGTDAAPVSCLVTNPVYSHSGQHILIPAGARLLGQTRPVQTRGETRLAVAFHRLLLPDGSSVALDQFQGLNQIGDAGLRDRVNHHYWSTFGAAAAVGLVSGLAQRLGTGGVGAGAGDRTVIIAGHTADATAQASVQVLNSFLNRLPTITIREGHRIKVYVTSDLDLPAWTPPGVGVGAPRR